MRRTRAPSSSSSTVTVRRSSPGTSEHARLDSASGSIGSTSPGTYTEFARRNASRSSADPGRTNAETSAMWTHTRITPPSNSSAEIASSKSLAPGGSIVNVVSARRSRRSGPATTSDAATRASRSTSGSKRRRRPRWIISASSTSRATSGRPIRRSIRARPPRPGTATTRSPRRSSRRGLSTLIRCPASNSDETARKRPCLSSTPTTGAALTPRPPSSAPSAAPRPARSPGRRSP